MAPIISCGECGTSISGEAPDARPEDRKPCPKCQSTRRSIQVSSADHVALHDTVTGALTLYEDALLDTARKMIDTAEYNLATVVTHMACEVSVERSMSKAWRDRGVADLEEPIEDLLNGHNLGNERIRKLFVGLTGKRIHEQPFWAGFQASAQRRNKIVHERLIVSKADAEASLAAATALIRSIGT